MRERSFLVRAVGLVAIAGAVAVLSSCGGDSTANGSGGPGTFESGNPNAKTLAGQALASPMAGPTPLEVDFSYEAKRSDGPVKIKWDFGDGTTSIEQNPTHTYKKAEFFAVRAVATDEGGNEDVWNLVLRGYKPEVWEAATDPNRPRKEGDVQAFVNDSQFQYYKKYPEALPADAKSTFYKQFPELKRLLKYRAKAIKEKGITVTPEGKPSEESQEGHE